MSRRSARIAILTQEISKLTVPLIEGSQPAAAGVVAKGTVTIDAADARVLVVSFPAALAAGDYTVNWTAVSDDGHKTTGSYRLLVAQ